MVSIVMGSDSDLGVMCEAAKILEKFGVDYEITILSAHRTPDRAEKLAREGETRGVDVFIAGAGGAAHLAGVIAAWTPLPVIGVPILSKSLGGADSLFSIAQMPQGIPVATVAIGGAANAGILAAQIIGVGNRELREKVREFKHDMAKTVNEKAEKLQNLGYKKYMEELK